MLQVVDLLESPGFAELGVALLSIAPDPPRDWLAEADRFDIPEGALLLSDGSNVVATAYDVMRWMAPTGEPGHTFVLIGGNGRILWIRDYGAPENGGVMYVPPDEIVRSIGPLLDPRATSGAP